MESFMTKQKNTLRNLIYVAVLAAGLVLAGCNTTDSGSGAAGGQTDVGSEAASAPGLTPSAPGLTPDEAALEAFLGPMPADITGFTSFEAIPGSLANQLAPPSPGEIYAVIHTDFGEIHLRLFPELAPLAVRNFMTHASNGYFDGLTFHRIVDTFMIQGGDPEGTGMGGESIFGETFGNELSPNLRHIRGALSMANSDNPQWGWTQTNGSQFFIVQNSGLEPFTVDDMRFFIDNQNMTVEELIGAQPIDELVNSTVGDVYPAEFMLHYLENGGTPHLDFGHTVFGQVFYGMDVVDAIAAVEVVDPIGDMAAGILPDHTPIEDVFIRSIELRTRN
jgi:peptidyl-prolyl cis-trans isomerase B (cyclophilin B)